MIYAIRLAFKQIKHRPAGAVLTSLLIALGVMLLALLFHAQRGYAERMERTIKGVDMVVGAKGSPLQLVLSAVYHTDVPTGNISLDDIAKLRKNPLVKSTIPLAYGDSYAGFRILGTTADYVELYGGELLSGTNWNASNEVVLGYNVFKRTGLTLGSDFHGSHGLVQGGEEHHDHPFKVVGLLAETGTVLDHLILTSVESIHQVHAHEGDVSDQITAMIVRFRNPLAMMQLPRMVNESTNMQAAVPRYEMERLLKVFGVGARAINALGLIIVLVAGLSMFIGMYNGLRERIPELSLMRTFGASPGLIIGMLSFEGLLVGLVGAVSGLLLTRLVLSMLRTNWAGARSFLGSSTNLLSEEVWILIGCVLMSIVVAVIPAIRVVRTELNAMNDV
jgi:putative ABC transport system permease protein